MNREEMKRREEKIKPVIFEMKKLQNDELLDFASAITKAFYLIISGEYEFNNQRDSKRNVLTLIWSNYVMDTRDIEETPSFEQIAWRSKKKSLPMRQH